MTLDKFFNPKSIAVIGACSDKNKVGYALMANLVGNRCATGSPQGEKNIKSSTLGQTSVFPVTLSEKEVLGLPAFASVKDIPEPVDLALIAIRADAVPQILLDCATKKIAAVTIIAAGFREVGEKGKELEEKCAQIAKENGIALLGPNCLGTIDCHSGLNASFGAQMPPTGGIAFLSQSGALGTSLLDLAIREGVGFSKFISLGNEASLTELEFLEYLGKDEDTKAILVYLEKLSNGSEFMRLASEITKKKPIVVLKSGRSSRGQRAVMSHTGSLAPADSVFTAACRQSGVITAESIREFFNLAKLFQLGILKPLHNLVILTNGGGPSVVAADLVDMSKALSLSELSEGTQNELRKVLPPMAAVGNPVDIIGDALSGRYADALKILCEKKDGGSGREKSGTGEDEIDGIIMMLTPQKMTEVEATAKLLIEYRNKKPIIPVFLGGPTVQGGVEVLKQAGLVNFGFPKDAVEALDDLVQMRPKKNDLEILGNYSHTDELIGKPSQKGEVRRGPESENSHSVLQPNSQSNMSTFKEMSGYFKEAGIQLSGTLVTEKSDLIKAASKLGSGPYVLKGLSEDIVHKTDAGVVKLNLNSIEETQKAWDAIQANAAKKFPQAKLEGMWLQKMGIGREVIIGMKRDAVFGPTILFGLGGIFTETLKDTSLRIAPINEAAAMEMILEIKGAGILTGLRGEKSVDLESLAELIVKISNMAMKHPEIKEIDLNPVMVTPKGAEVVDARVMVQGCLNPD